LNSPGNISAVPSFLKSLLTRQAQIRRLAPLRSLDPRLKEQKTKPRLHPYPLSKPVNPDLIPQVDEPPGGAASLRTSLILVATHYVQVKPRSNRLFQVSGFARDLRGLVLKTSHGCVFRVGEDPLSYNLIRREMLESGRFVDSKRGKYLFINGYPPLEPRYPFENFCELVHHQLEEQHLMGGEAGAFLPIETLERQLAGHFYRTKSGPSERVEIYIPTGSLRKTLLQLQERGFGLFWFDRTKVGMIKYSPDETGFVPMKGQERKLWPQVVARRYNAECAARHAPGDDDIQILAHRILQMNAHFYDSLPKEQPVEESTCEEEQIEPQWEVPLITDNDYKEGSVDDSRAAKKVVAPPPLPWTPQDMGAVQPDLLAAVQELRESGEKMSLDRATESLHPVYGDGKSKWECCLDIIEAIGFLHAASRERRRSLAKTEDVAGS
jgi:hypothetical protein